MAQVVPLVYIGVNERIHVKSTPMLKNIPTVHNFNNFYRNGLVHGIGIGVAVNEKCITA